MNEDMTMEMRGLNLENKINGNSQHLLESTNRKHKLRHNRSANPRK